MESYLQCSIRSVFVLCFHVYSLFCSPSPFSFLSFLFVPLFFLSCPFHFPSSFLSPPFLLISIFLNQFLLPGFFLPFVLLSFFLFSFQFSFTSIVFMTPPPPSNLLLHIRIRPYFLIRPNLPSRPS